MKRITLFAIVFVMGHFSYSQSNALQAPRFETSGLGDIQLQNNFNNFMLQTHSQFAKGQLNEFTGLGGPQRFFSNVWVSGTATNPQDVVLGKPYVFNFDFKEHELYAQWKDTGIVVNSNYLKSFMLMENGQPHYFLRAPEIHTKYFFESLGYEPDKSNRKVQLLKLRTIKVMKTNKNDYAAAFNGDYSDKLKNEIEYYILNQNNTYSKVKLNKKSLSEALASHKTIVDGYFAQHDKLNENNIANLIRIINQ